MAYVVSQLRVATVFARYLGMLVALYLTSLITYRMLRLSPGMPGFHRDWGIKRKGIITPGIGVVGAW